MNAVAGMTAAIVALALLWLAVAIAIAIVAARRFRLAETVLGAARSSAALLETTPARPLLVRPDHRLEIDSQLQRDLGLARTPSRLSDLITDDGRIDADDLQLLTADVEAAQLSAH